MNIERIAVFHGFIVTANADGSIPLNAKVLARVDGEYAAGAAELVEAFNQMRDERYGE